MIQFTYLPRWSWIIGGTCIILALLWWSYRAAKGKPKTPLKAALIGLRLLAIGAVTLCLLDPQWVEIIKHQPWSRMAVLLDTSRSMSSRDVPGGRLDMAKEWVEKKILPLAPSGVSLPIYTFDQSITALPSLDSASPTGSVTALSDSLEGLLSMPSEDPLTGVI